jgi:hypothetical protein
MVRYSEIIKDQEKIERLQHIREILENNFELTGDYHINDDETVTAQHCSLSRSYMKKLLIKFRYVKYLTLDYAHNLETLEGCPDDCGVLNVKLSKIKNLVGGPTKVEAMGLINNFQLESLDGMPIVERNFMLCGSPLLKFGWNVPQKYLDKISGTFIIGYEEDLPLLRMLDPNYEHGKVSIWFDLDDNILERKINEIIWKYKEDDTMPLYEKQMRCQHELLEYPEYRLNAR